MTGYLRQAFAADFHDRARDSNFVGPDKTYSVHDIDLANVWAPDPEGVPPRLSAPRVRPGQVGGSGIEPMVNATYQRAALARSATTVTGPWPMLIWP
ncbi:hypothetical protein AB6813_00985 [bacterium RCC_150]